MANKPLTYERWLATFPSREDCPEMTDQQYKEWRNFEEYAFFCK